MLAPIALDPDALPSQVLMASNEEAAVNYTRMQTGSSKRQGGCVIIRVRCAWCQDEMGEEVDEKIDARLPFISHGICPVCKRRVFGYLENLREQSANSKTN